MKYHRIVVAIFLLTLPMLLFMSCERALEDIAEVRQAIESLNKQWKDAFNMGDAAAIAALYTEEARLLPPNSPILVGKEAIQNFYQSSINDCDCDLQLTTLEVVVARDLAYEIGEYASIQPEEGEAIRDQGKYVYIWKRENGRWKIDVDIFNSSPRQ